MKIVIAIGGNMISDAANKKETYDEQLKRVENTANIIAGIKKLRHQLIITHGNGPQVGSLLLQQQTKAQGAIELPMSLLGALTQGQIGIMLQHAILDEFKRNDIGINVVIMPTTVIVDENDPGFTNPTKPVGPFYSDQEYEEISKENKTYVKLAKGHRRVVASPIPQKILEAQVIEQLIDKNVVVAVGGGGSPTVYSDGNLKRVDAVIDKDMASSLLATQIDADVLMILTNIEGVYTNFGKENEELKSVLSKEQAEKLLEGDGLGAGSMKPKVQACTNFLKPGKIAIITSPENAIAALKEEAGTIFKMI